MRRILLVFVVFGLWLGAVQAQNIITPEQAIEAMRQFCGDPNLPVTVEGLWDSDPSIIGGYYRLEAQSDPWRGAYKVRASDGRVLSMILDDSEPSQPPTLTREQAQAIAEQFARQHYPLFDQRQWFLWPAKYGKNGPKSFDFFWQQVLNEHGTLAPDYLSVQVDGDGDTGRVMIYFEPFDEINAPTVPQITREQAIQIATPHAVYDPAVVPFSEIYLKIGGDATGVQWLHWELMQFPEPTDETLHYSVIIDAITGGFVGLSVPLSGEGPGKRRRPPRPLPKRITLRSQDGRVIWNPVKDRDRLWVRVEVLRRFEAKVDVKPSVKVRVGNRTFTGEALGAKQRDYGWWARVRKPPGVKGWWIPLRRAVERLGWRVEWFPLKQEAVVYLPPDMPKDRTATNPISGR
jgi:hypothetical protein